MIFKRTKPAELDMKNIPKHIGVIMDGNGRWAKKRGLPRSAGHKMGAKTLETIADYCSKLGVEVITAYAFSTENWSRPKDEVDAIMKLLYDYLIEAKTKFVKNDAKLVISGDKSKFDEKLKTAMDNAIEATKHGSKITINLALNYGGRDELVRAARSLCKKTERGELSPDGISEDVIEAELDTAGMPEVDLIIRPSGEMRLSNFLLWQAAYAEFWYSNVCWPDFKPSDMRAAIIDYQKRNRRFGGV